MTDQDREYFAGDEAGYSDGIDGRASLYPDCEDISDYAVGYRSGYGQGAVDRQSLEVTS